MLKSKSKGIRFERIVKKAMVRKGYYAKRNPSSLFPDVIALKKGETMAIECKWNKYINKEERDKFKELEQYFDFLLIAFPEKDRKDKRKKEIVFCNLNYQEQFRLGITN